MSETCDAAVGAADQRRGNYTHKRHNNTTRHRWAKAEPGELELRVHGGEKVSVTAPQTLTPGRVFISKQLCLSF